MSAPAQRAAKPGEEPLLRAFALLFGAFLGLALLKFGNPPVMEKFVTPPANIYEFLLGAPWPISWAYKLLLLVAIPGLILARWQPGVPRWLLVLPLVWFAWQVVAASNAVSAALAWPTVWHFAACLLCFYLGYFSLSRARSLAAFWIPLCLAFLIVLAVGWDQRFGGLEATRKYFWTYLYPTLHNIPPEYLKKLSSNRIFSTLFYPNTLAGALLLLLPIVLGLIANARRWLTAAARGFLVISVGLAALGCLYWSGSKGGWLLMLGIGLLVLSRVPLPQSYKLGVVAAVLLVGIAGFFWTYSRFFEKGATSVVARFDYWRAALAITRAHPWVGTGPGTFAIPYSEIKDPRSEMARLAHNDYLEQASDSGVPGFLAYLAFIAAALVFTCPWCRRLAGITATDPATPLPAASSLKPKGPANAGGKKLEAAPPGVLLGPEAVRHSLEYFLIRAGVLAWAMHSFIEFDLYIPALAWTAFTFLGLLLAKNSRVCAN